MRFVDGDTVEPGIESAVAAKRTERTVGLDEGLLGHVLDLVGRLHRGDAKRAACGAGLGYLAVDAEVGNAMQTLAYQFSAERMVIDYVEQMYQASSTSAIER